MLVGLSTVLSTAGPAGAQRRSRPTLPAHVATRTPANPLRVCHEQFPALPYGHGALLRCAPANRDLLFGGCHALPAVQRLERQGVYRRRISRWVLGAHALRSCTGIWRTDPCDLHQRP